MSRNHLEINSNNYPRIRNKKLAPGTYLLLNVFTPKTISPKYTSLKPVIVEVKPNGCWEVISHKQNFFGYIVLRRDRERKLAHRWAYEIWNGTIPDNFNVLHHCDNPPCICPNHLFVGTQADNVHDMIEKKRNFIARGERNPRAKLSDKQINEIRLLHSEKNVSAKKLSDDYRITYTYVHKILRNASRASSEHGAHNQ